MQSLHYTSCGTYQNKIFDLGWFWERRLLFGGSSIFISFEMRNESWHKAVWGIRTVVRFFAVHQRWASALNQQEAIWRKCLSPWKFNTKGVCQRGGMDCNYASFPHFAAFKSSWINIKMFFSVSAAAFLKLWITRYNFIYSFIIHSRSPLVTHMTLSASTTLLTPPSKSYNQQLKCRMEQLWEGSNLIRSQFEVTAETAVLSWYWTIYNSQLPVSTCTLFTLRGFLEWMWVFLKYCFIKTTTMKLNSVFMCCFVGLMPRMPL